MDYGSGRIRFNQIDGLVQSVDSIPNNKQHPFKHPSHFHSHKYLSHLSPLPPNSTHTLQLAGQFRVLLLHLDLRAGGLGVRQRVDQLALGARQLRRPLKVPQRLRHLALLQQQLRHGRDRDVAFGVN